MRKKLQKMGNSVGVILPARLRRGLNLEVGSLVEMTEERSAIMIRKVPDRPRLSQITSRTTRMVKTSKT